MRVIDGDICIVKNVVVIIKAMKDDVEAVSNGRYICLVTRIIIAISIAVTVSTVVHVAVHVAVSVVNVVSIYVSVAIADAVAIPEAVTSVRANAFVGPVTDDVIGVGITGAIFGNSRLTLDMIGFVSN